jgi:DNA (cytosine-5)-methyltransferase 1
MKVGSLFSGIGGLDLGLERAGMTIAWQVEIDEFCRRILDKYWPHVPKYGDIREVDPSTLPPADLICGGFPCQPVSVAGQRKGREDLRWLWPEFARIVRGVKPRWVLVENVPGLLTVNGGEAFAEVLSDLAACGYDAEWDCIPAAAFGAPHLRYRLFLVAYPAGRQCHPGAKVSREFHGDCANGEGSHHAHGPSENSELGGGRERAIFRPPIPSQSDCWQAEPHVGRVAHGIPHAVDRLRALGNAVVPQVAEWIGRRILEADQQSPDRNCAGVPRRDGHGQ